MPMCSSRCSEAAAHRQLECKVLYFYYWCIFYKDFFSFNARCFFYPWYLSKKNSFTLGIFHLCHTLQVFAAEKNSKNKVVISDFTANNPFYQCIAALRWNWRETHDMHCAQKVFKEDIKIKKGPGSRNKITVNEE